MEKLSFWPAGLLNSAALVMFCEAEAEAENLNMIEDIFGKEDEFGGEESGGVCNKWCWIIMVLFVVGDWDGGGGLINELNENFNGGVVM